MQNLGSNLIAVATSIVGLAMLAVLVSRNAQTPQVIASTGAALADTIGAATAPVTGGSRTPKLYNFNTH